MISRDEMPYQFLLKEGIYDSKFRRDSDPRTQHFVTQFMGTNSFLQLRP